MNTPWRIVLVLGIGALLVWVLVVWQRDHAAPPRERAAPAGTTRELAAPEPAPGPAPPGAQASVPRETAHANEPAPLEPAAPPRSRVAAKFARESLSDVPHELLGAWDDAPDAPEPGAHRTFVIVVDPSISSAELASLTRDIRDRHRDAEVLDVRIYDVPASVIDMGGVIQGEGRKQHLVADLKRNDRLSFEQMRIRGTVVTP